MAKKSSNVPPDAVAGGSQWSPLATAAIVGGAVAATAGAVLGTRALAKRLAERDGRPLNSVMATAVTACDLAKTSFASADEPSAADIQVAPPA